MCRNIGTQKTVYNAKFEDKVDLNTRMQLKLLEAIRAELRSDYMGL